MEYNVEEDVATYDIKTNIFGSNTNTFVSDCSLFFIDNNNDSQFLVQRDTSRRQKELA